MRRAHSARRFLLIACLIVSSVSHAEATVNVEASATIVRISAEIGTSVNRDTAWKVLSDYDHWAEFIPDMIVSRVVSKPGETLLVEQRGVIPWMRNFPLVVIASIEEDAGRGLKFQRVAGNLKAMEGEWQIKGKSKVRLVYRSTVEPGFPLPPQMSVEIFRHDAKVKLEAMAQEMARRKSRGAGRK
jgi:hypothetical protein